MRCLEKTPGSTDVNGYRPITLFSTLYRLWAGHRSRQLLAYLARFGDTLQCGYAHGHEASDIWYHVQTLIEVQIMHGEELHGAVGDLVKAFNLLPRLPIFHMMSLVGIEDSFLDCWRRFQAGLSRRFTVRDSCGPPLYSVTGFPEGCPLSCVGMYVVDVVWHHYQHHFSSISKPLSYVDNLEVLSTSAPAVVHGVTVMREWCSIMDVELDEKKLALWSTSKHGRKYFRDNGFSVIYSGRDLGGQVNYGKGLRNSVIVKRMQGLDACFAALTRSLLSRMQKRLCIFGSLLPRGLHGSESTTIGDQHFVALGGRIMRALHWKRSGASQSVRLGLLNTDDLDPKYFCFWRVLALARRQFTRFDGLRSLWRKFLSGLAADRSATCEGPFSVLHTLLSLVGWRLDADILLWISADISLPFLSSPISLLKELALWFWRQHRSLEILSRDGFSDLDGFEHDLIASVNRSLDPRQVELLKGMEPFSLVSTFPVLIQESRRAARFVDVLILLNIVIARVPNTQRCVPLLVISSMLGMNFRSRCQCMDFLQQFLFAWKPGKHFMTCGQWKWSVTAILLPRLCSTCSQMGHVSRMVLVRWPHGRFDAVRAIAQQFVDGCRGYAKL